MLISFDDATRLIRMQERLRQATWHEMKKDGHHKSSEGALNISFNLPPVVGDEREPYWAVEAYSYLLCPVGRSETWTGRSATEAIGKAEDAIEKWCFGAEMEMFERDVMGGPPEDDGAETSEDDIPA